MDTPTLIEVHSAWLTGVVAYMQAHAEFSYAPIIQQLYAKPTSPDKFAALTSLPWGSQPHSPPPYTRPYARRSSTVSSGTVAL